MIIDVPYAYEATIRRPRKRNTEDVNYRGTVSVRIEERWSAQAPVAVRFPHPDLRHDENPRAMEIRWADGRLWRPVEEREGDGPRQVSQADFLEMVARGERGSPLHGWSDEGVRSMITRESDPQIADVITEGSEEAAKAVATKAADVMLIEGSLWEACEEPVLLLSTSNRGDYAWVKVGWSRSERPQDMFRLDQAEWIFDVRPDLLGTRETVTIPEFDLIVPEALSANVTARAVHAAAVSMADHMAEQVVFQDAAYFSAFAALRDVLPLKHKHRARPDMPVDFDAPRVAELLESAMEAEGKLHREDEYDRVQDWLAEEVRGALKRVELSGQEAALELTAAFD